MSPRYRKSVEQLRADASTSQLRQVLGPVQLTALGIGAVIGSGIFVLAGQAAAQNAGPAVVLSFVIAGFACVLAGLCYAELASVLPVAGSAYSYAYATLGELAAWLVGWDLILEYALGAATVAVAWSGYAVSFLHDIGIEIPAAWTGPPGVAVALADGSTVQGVFNLPAALVVLAAAGLLILGIRATATVNMIAVLIKVAVILLFIGVGAAYVNPGNWLPFVPEATGARGEYGVTGVLSGAVVVFFAYLGFDTITVAAQETRAPQRNVPAGILATLLIVTVLYMAVAIVLTGLVPYTSLNVADPLATGTNATGLLWVRPIIKVGAVAGMFSVMLVLMMAQPRILYAMARDGLMPQALKRVHARFHTPHVATAITGLAVALVSGLFSLQQLSQLVSIGTLFAFVVVCAAALVLRKRQPERARRFRAPALWLVAPLGIVICVYLMLSLSLATWLRLLIWLGIGLAAYYGYGRAASDRARAARNDVYPSRED